MEQTLLHNFAVKEGEEPQTAARKNGSLLRFALPALCFLIGSSCFFYAGPQRSLMITGTLLLLGSVYALVAEKIKTTPAFRTATAHPLYEAAIISLAISLPALFFTQIEWVKILCYAAAFLLPAVIYKAWKLYEAIPESAAALWYFSAEMPSKPIFVSFENTVIHLKVLKNGSVFLLTTQVPKHLSLGLAFYFALQEQKTAGKTALNFLLEDGHPCGWRFYTTFLGLWKRNLHPEETLYESRLKSKAIIVAECFTAPDAQRPVTD